MKVLIIGGGGREHALAWKLAQSEKTEEIFVAPGNGGTAAEEKTKNISLEGKSPESEEAQHFLLDFAQKEKIDLTVVGPEIALEAGIVDKFRAAELAIVGPSQKAARLETSKIYSKAFMEKYKVRSAKSKSFKAMKEALDYVDKHFKNSKAEVPPLVIKADGLAAGKGVVICQKPEEAKEIIRLFMKDGVIGEAGKSLLMEEFLEGTEVSILAAVSVSPGKKGVIKPFLPARDHKSIYENGEGPNTGGMGVIAPLPDFTPPLQKDFANNILLPTLKGLEAEKIDYRGFLFFGLMVSKGTVYLLEYNVRLGDPETQALLPLMDTDFSSLCNAIINGSLGNFPIEWKNLYSCEPVAASYGYPGEYIIGENIAINADGLKLNGSKIFIAGAERGPGGALGSGLKTKGGRVLSAAGLAESPEEAYRKAYEALRCIDFESMYYRMDIGKPPAESI